MPPKAKKQSLNQHDKRHDIGPVAPGKRVVKQKSNGNLNGHAEAPVPSPLPVLSERSTRIRSPPRSESTADLTLENHEMGSGRKVQDESEDGRGSDTSSGDASQTAHGAEHSLQLPARGEEVNTVKMSKIPGSGVVILASTVLSACPLRDVLAILIILIQLPPTVLTVIQCLFALLTFVPPTTGLSLSSAFNINAGFAEFFQNFGILAGYSGAPSLGVTILVDAIMLFLWLFVPSWVQPVFLDMSQAVIAISLGGGFQSKGGSGLGFAYGLSIILLVQIFRYGQRRDMGLASLSSWVPNTRFDPFSLSTTKAKPSQSSVAGVPWWNALLIVHILVQFGMRQAVRALSRKGLKSDLEVAAPSLLASSMTTTADGTNDSGSTSSTDGRPPGPPPVSREVKEKGPSTRQKKKQASQVRSQQPFWAALASTKVHVLKEMEQKQAKNDAMEAEAADASAAESMKANGQGDLIWVSEIASQSIRFIVNSYEGSGEQANHEDQGSGFTKMRPFYVRINGAEWSSTRISRVTHADKGGSVVWEGEICGLTPLSNYTCNFVRSSDDAVVFSTSLITQPPSSTESTPATSPPAQRPLVPSSPTTTLKNSIAAAEQKLEQQRARAKRIRKDHKACLATIKKEVDSFSSRLSSAGGNDDKQRQRALQMNQHIRQAEDAISSVESEIAALGDIPTSDVNAAAATEAIWQNERSRLDAVRTETSDGKNEAERQVSAVQAEVTNAIQKRDRLIARRERLVEQLNHLKALKARTAEESSKREKDRVATLTDREAEEQRYLGSISHYEHQAEDFRIKTASVYQSIHYLENSWDMQHKQHPGGSPIPTTPEGIIPGTGPMSRSHSNHPVLGFQFPQIPDSNPASHLRGGRGRSSSMLSNVSGFTDQLDGPASVQKFNPKAMSFAVEERKRSEGSGSPVGSTSSSQKDPASPYPRVVGPLKMGMARSPSGH